MKDKPKNAQLNVRLPYELVEDFRKMVPENERSAVVRDLLEAFMAGLPVDASAPTHAVVVRDSSVVGVDGLWKHTVPSLFESRLPLYIYLADDVSLDLPFLSGLRDRFEAESKTVVLTPPSIENPFQLPDSYKNEIIREIFNHTAIANFLKFKTSPRILDNLRIARIPTDKSPALKAAIVNEEIAYAFPYPPFANAPDVYYQYVASGSLSEGHGSLMKILSDAAASTRTIDLLGAWIKINEPQFSRFISH